MNAAILSGKPDPAPSILFGPPIEGEPDRTNNSDDFHDRHRRLRYVMDFFKSKEYVMKNSRFDMKQRVLEAAKLTAWANFSDFAADGDGKPLSHTALATLIGASTQRVSEAVKELVEEFCLKVDERVTYVIDDPDLELKLSERRTNGEPFPGRTGKSEEKAKALAFLAENDPSWFSDYQETDREFHRLFAARKRKQDEAIRIYRAAQQKQESGSDPTPPEEDVSRTYRETEEAVDFRDVRGNLPGTSGKTDPPILMCFKASKELASYAPESPEMLIGKILERTALADLPGNPIGAVRNASRYLVEAPNEQKAALLAQFESDCLQLAARRRNKPKNVGIVVRLMEDAAAAVRQGKTSVKKLDQQTELATDNALSLEEQIRSEEDFLANFPDHHDADKARRHLRHLEQRLLERKTVQHEINPRRQKASEG